MRDDEYARNNHLFPRAGDSLVLSEGCTLCQEAGLGFIGKDIIWGNGAKAAKLMVVGQDSAGGQPDQPLWRGSRCTEIPLTNRKTGAKLRIMLSKAGLDPFSVFITNTVKCNVGYDERTLSYAALVQVCIEHLRRELDVVRPKVMIVLGEKAAQRVSRLWNNRRILPSTGLDPAETLEQFPAFAGAVAEVTRTQAGDSTVEVFSFKHPSYVEGPREAAYVANLRAIAARLA